MEYSSSLTEIVDMRLVIIRYRVYTQKNAFFQNPLQLIPHRHITARESFQSDASVKSLLLAGHLLNIRIVSCSVIPIVALVSFFSSNYLFNTFPETHRADVGKYLLKKFNTMHMYILL